MRMKYRIWNGGVETVYAYSPVEHSFYTGGGYDPDTDRQRKGNFIFLFRNGKTVSHPGLTDWTYGAFHGLTVSADGTRFFQQNWQTGVRCYDIKSGKLLWKNRIRHTRALLVSENTLTAVTGDRTLVCMSVRNGKLLHKEPGWKDIYDVTERLCLAVDRNGAGAVLDKDTLGKQFRCRTEPVTACNIIDVLPYRGELYAVEEYLTESVPRELVYRMHRLGLPEKPDEAVWKSACTEKRLKALRQICGIGLEEA